MRRRLIFRPTADAYALDVIRDEGLGRGEIRVASLQWHPDQGPRLVVSREFTSFTLEELKELSFKLEAEVEAYRFARRPR